MKTSKTREQRNQSKMFLALAIVSWTIIMAVIIAYLTTLTAEGTSDPVAAEPPIETRKTARDEVEEEYEEISATEYSTIPTVEEILSEANVMEDCTITHYCTELYPHICGEGHGITYSGRPVEAYVSVAVDKDIIPLGSTVYIDYGDGDIRKYRADDIGGGVNGNHVDVAVTTHEEALQEGLKTATVYWIEGEEK